MFNEKYLRRVRTTNLQPDDSSVDNALKSYVPQENIEHPNPSSTHFRGDTV